MDSESPNAMSGNLLQYSNGLIKMMMLNRGCSVNGRQRRRSISQEFIILSSMIQVMAQASDKQRQFLENGSKIVFVKIIIAF